MAKDPTVKVKPWCPFCGQDVAQPQEPKQRKMDEFNVGYCECGAVYTSDPSGFNVGAAMVECIVHACGDNWDLAWDLLPEDDYLTGRLEKYDEQTHQVIELGNLDGRIIRGVLYFVRLHKDISELTDTIKPKPYIPKSEEIRTISKPVKIEPARDPGRKRKKATKAAVKALVDAENIDGLVDLAFDDIKVLRFMQRLLYAPNEEKMMRLAHMFGQVCSRLATRKPGKVSDLLHRLYEACADSAATHWGIIEAIGSIIAAKADLFGGFTRHLLMYAGTESSRVQVIWALATIAKERPDLIRNMPFIKLFSLLKSEDPKVRGHLVWLFGRINASEVRSQIKELTNDQSKIEIYENGISFETSIANLANEALKAIDSKNEE
jgi:hypothetical protein